MTVAITPLLTGQEALLQTLAAIPERVQNRVFRLAGRKAGKAIAVRAGQLTPRQKKPVPEHLADRMISKQKVYKTSTVNIIGGRSGGHNRINHLVEEGTAQRFTRHKSAYGPGTSRVVMRSRKVQTKSGGWRTVKVQEVVRKKKSLGSRYVGTGIARNRGKMPAFHQLRRAVEQTPVKQIMETEIRGALQRIADKF